MISRPIYSFLELSNCHLSSNVLTHINLRSASIPCRLEPCRVKAADYKLGSKVKQSSHKVGLCVMIKLINKYKPSQNLGHLNAPLTVGIITFSI